MRLTLFTIILLLHGLAICDQYTLQSSSKTITNELKITKEFSYKNIEIDGRWTDSEGEYGINKCIGNLISKDNTISLEAYCEKIDSVGDKAWFKINRNSEMDGGIGLSTYLSATGKYKKFIGLQCPYAVKYFDKQYNFYLHKCNLDKDKQ